MSDYKASLLTWVVIFAIFGALTVWLYSHGHPTAAKWTLIIMLVDAIFGSAPQGRTEKSASGETP